MRITEEVEKRMRELKKTGMTYTDIALSLGCSLGSVKNYLRLAPDDDEDEMPAKPSSRFYHPFRDTPPIRHGIA